MLSIHGMAPWLLDEGSSVASSKQARAGLATRLYKRRHQLYERRQRLTKGECADLSSLDGVGEQTPRARAVRQKDAGVRSAVKRAS